MDLPIDFITRTRGWLGDAYPLLEAALQEEAPVSIRINPAKPTLPDSLGEPVAWCATGFYLPERPAFTFDPSFHAGLYYVQEASSMFLEQAIKQYVSAPVLCLDACAAPGGKATHLTSLLPEGSLLVGNEIVRNRCAVLMENLCKWGSPHTVVTHNEAGEIGRLTALFDVIVADLPCSGEGMFRKDAGSRAEWSVNGVERCAARQRKIVRELWPALKPGGLFVYSTCTFNREENEENLSYLADTLGAEGLPVRGFGTADGGRWPVYRFYPHEVKGEGFCLSVLRKPDGPRKTFAGKRKSAPATSPFPSPVGEWLNDPGNYVTQTESSVIRAIPREHAGILRLLSEQLRVLSAGILLGRRQGGEIRPSTALAMSTAFRRAAFPSYALTWEESIRYLQGEALTLPAETPKGFTVVTYRQTPLGFVKNTGPRANNLYPKAWRIRARMYSLECRVSISSCP